MEKIAVLAFMFGLYIIRRTVWNWYEKHGQLAPARDDYSADEPVYICMPFYIGAVMLLWYIDVIPELITTLVTFLLPWLVPRLNPLSVNQSLELTVVGLMIYLAGWCVSCSGRLWLGRAWANKGKMTHQPNGLVTSGIYGWCRNPIYLGFFITWVGYGLTFGLLHLWLLAPVCVYAWVMAVQHYHRWVIAEEKFLAQRYGQVYEVYCQEVPRYLPIGGLRRLVHSVDKHFLSLGGHGHPVEKH
ncbi:MAG: isoprenylcysteine carboxylmethyltransferase family protein [Candidatus Kerfeldbacteria bacterium]|nr:isoprenylcysteine carboxylmethyltransferase family protein [Candidatus Kerfeldbacteria bacterium]